ncbi:hypothetical protein ACWOAH_04550 [Vagococcus vulneris]|uniref:Uncharacterized protein n=1 Tax=Vagococcus vulneris TaxID=1977869 RepID=A0A430A095_9ENTE|nr:hypothetical protein [Vagococcus vulneris]RST99752.1 hypothetical protein CBF37_03235 [Vagococcus vulneris]
MITKLFKTVTYGNSFPLKICADDTMVFPKNIEISAQVDMDTGEVKLLLTQENLNKLKKITND